MNFNHEVAFIIHRLLYYFSLFLFALLFVFFLPCQGSTQILHVNYRTQGSERACFPVFSCFFVCVSVFLFFSCFFGLFWLMACFFYILRWIHKILYHVVDISFSTSLPINDYDYPLSAKLLFITHSIPEIFNYVCQETSFLQNVI